MRGPVVSRFRAVCQEPLACLAYTNLYLSTYRPTFFFPPFVHSSSLQPVDVAATRDPVNSTSLAGTTYRVSRNFKRNAQRSIEPSPFFQTLHDRSEGKFERKEDRFSKLLFLDGLKSLEWIQVSRTSVSQVKVEDDWARW